MIEPCKNYFIIEFRPEMKPKQLKGSLLLLEPIRDISFAVILKTPNSFHDWRVGDMVYVWTAAAHRFDENNQDRFIHIDYIIAEYVDK